MAVIVTDENLGTRLAKELRARGRNAETVHSLHLRGVEDNDLLEGLAALSYDWVLFTADDRLPWQWASVIRALDATIATIHPKYPGNYVEAQWHHDVGHRWAHSIAEQDKGTVRRYSISGHRLWTVPRGR